MLKKMKIGPKLIMCFIIVVVAASIAGVIGTVMMLNLDTKYSKALIVNGFSQGEIGKFNTSLNKAASTVRDLVLVTEEQDIKDAQTELNELTDQTTEAFETMKKNTSTDEENKFVSIIEEKLPAYRSVRDQVVELGLKNENDKALKIFREEALPILEEVQNAADDLTELNVKMGTAASADLTASSRTSMIINIIIIIATVAGSVLFSIVIARSIARPIGVVQKAAEQMEKGDLNIHIDSDARDEVGDMTRAFAKAADMMRGYIKDISDTTGRLASGDFTVELTEKFQGDFIKIEEAVRALSASLNSTLIQINQSADQVSSGSEQVSSGAQALSQGATEQASSVEELAATITEISQNVQNNADNAKSASDKVNMVGSEAEESNRRMQEMLTAISEISDRSNEIGKIIKTIEDIAFQTNILALNAAVEAARAGEAGKGFAVVADEVRNLASKSAEASKNTSVLIEASLHAVENGTKIADDTAQSLDQVVQGVGDVRDTINQISSSSDEQADSIKQVTLGVDQISSVVQTNSATAEESAAASEELSGQAQVLKDMVNEFKLKDESAAHHVNTAAPAQSKHSYRPSASVSYAEPAKAAGEEYHEASIPQSAGSYSDKY